MAKPKYEEGTKFRQWKYFDWDKPSEEIEGNYLVDCILGGRIWESPDLGWVYSATPSEPVMCGDNNWNRTMEESTSSSDKELDEYFAKNKL